VKRLFHRPLNPWQEPARFGNLDGEIRQRDERGLGTAGAVLHHTGGDIDLEFVPILHHVDYSRALYNRETVVDGVPEEDARETVGDHTPDPGAPERPDGVLAG